MGENSFNSNNPGPPPKDFEYHAAIFFNTKECIAS